MIKVSEVVSAALAYDSSCFKGAAGASKGDMDFLVRKLGRPLPSAYHDFLSCLGRSSGNVVLDDAFDFSLPALREVLEDLEAPVLVLPIATNTGGDAPSLLCLDLDGVSGYADPSVYAMFSPVGERDAESQWAEHFSTWMAGRVLIKSLVDSSKYIVEIRPDLTRAYFAWALTCDVDATVCRLLESLEFRPFFPGSGVFLRADRQFVAYRRSSGRSGFVLRVGSNLRELRGQLQASLSEVIKTGFVVDIF